MSNFNDKVVLVTGSSSGIGAATAIRFAKEGAKLIITGRNAEALSKVADEIGAVSKYETLQVVGDFLDLSFAERLMSETIAKFGKLDVLVNNAGLGGDPDTLDNPNLMELFDKIYTINVRSLLQMTQLAMPHLEKTKGNIVNVSSIVAHLPFVPVYGSSKAAVDMLTKTTAKELASKGIRVNSVNPGPVNTAFLRARGLDAQTSSAAYKKLAPCLPLKYMPNGDDIANIILFLANDKFARNMSGSIVVSDSGMLLDIGCVRDIKIEQ